MKYPTTDEIVLPNGRRQEFQGAWIYYSPIAGTHVVQGAILDKYKAMGAQGSPLGYPTSDEQSTPDGKGKFNTFEKGSIYWSAATGAHWITTDMVESWGGEGYESGSLGYPTEDPSFDQQSDSQTQQFQYGSLTIETTGDFTFPWTNADGDAKVCTGKARIDSIHKSESLDNGQVRPRTVSAHAYWIAGVECPKGVKGKLWAQLQTRNPDGVWADRGASNERIVYAGGGSSKWVPVNYLCKGNANNTWRVEMDLDILGYFDTPFKSHSGNKDFECGVV